MRFLGGTSSTSPYEEEKAVSSPLPLLETSLEESVESPVVVVEEFVPSI